MSGYFTLGDEGEIETNKFFPDKSEMAKFIDKILVQNSVHLYILQAIIIGILENLNV